MNLTLHQPVSSTLRFRHPLFNHLHRHGPVLCLIADGILAIQGPADHATVHGRVIHLREVTSRYKTSILWILYFIFQLNYTTRILSFFILVSSKQLLSSMATQCAARGSLTGCPGPSSDNLAVMESLLRKDVLGWKRVPAMSCCWESVGISYKKKKKFKC